MPTYLYQCSKCGHRFELFHGIKDDRPRRCPRCRGRARRVPAAGAGLLFKGAGFYITDNRSKSYREMAKQDKAGGGKEASGGGKERSGGGKETSGGGTEAPGGAKKKRDAGA